MDLSEVFSDDLKAQQRWRWWWWRRRQQQQQQQQQQTTTTSFCGTPLHIQIFCHKALKINENSSHNDDAPVFYEQVP